MSPLMYVLFGAHINSQITLQNYEARQGFYKAGEGLRDVCIDKHRMTYTVVKILLSDFLLSKVFLY